jgi:hypothetical protein
MTSLTVHRVRVDTAPSLLERKHSNPKRCDGLMFALALIVE